MDLVCAACSSPGHHHGNDEGDHTNHDDHNDDDEDDNAEPLKIGCVSLKNGWPMDSCPTQ